MYIYHEQCEIMQKLNETAQKANFNDAPLIFCGSGLKWTKTMQTAKRKRLFFLLKKFLGIQGIPCES